MLALLDPETPPEVVQWATQYGVRPMNDVLVSADRANLNFGVGARTMVVYDSYGAHPITRGMQDVITLFPLTEGLSMAEAAIPGVTGNAILLTGPMSWSEQDPAEQFSGKPTYDPAVDHRGPLAFGVALQIAHDEHEPGRLVVVGNSEFASNANLALYGNRDLLLNMVGWLAREEPLVELRGRELLSQPVVLTTLEKQLVGWGTVVLWPFLVGTAALVGVLRHRRRH